MIVGGASSEQHCFLTSSCILVKVILQHRTEPATHNWLVYIPMILYRIIQTAGQEVQDSSCLIAIVTTYISERGTIWYNTKLDLPAVQHDRSRSNAFIHSCIKDSSGLAIGVASVVASKSCRMQN
jgi:hypothetical protein